MTEMHLFESDILIHALQITAWVFGMMVLIDWLDVRTRGRIPQWMTRRKGSQYLLASILGLTPGCMGAYMNVSLYMHGYLSIGAMVGGMIATSGEAALIMFALFPKTAILLHLILISSGIIFAAISDIIVNKLGISHQVECESVVYHKDETSFFHYVKEHIWRHIIKKHIWRIFLWTFFAIWFVHLGTHYFDLQGFVSDHSGLMLIMALLIGIVPDVAPQFIFVIMFAEGLIPFSVLLTSSMAQNGHALLPLLSYSLKDTITIKSFNIIFALITGSLVMALGF
jgi:hypothetical protein